MNQQGQAEEIRKTAVGYGDRVNPDRAKSPQISNCENAVLALMLLYPDHRKAASSPEIALTEEDFFTSLGKRIFRFLSESTNGQALDGMTLNESFTDDEIGRITELKVTRMHLSDNGDTAFLESVKALRSAMKRRELDEGTTSLNDLDSMIRAMRSKE